MRLLLVDPDEAFASDAIAALAKSGIEAVHASSPDQMRAQLRMKNFNIVVIDLSLRRMNGFDVARELRVEHPSDQVEIVLISPRHKSDSPEIQSLKRDTQSRLFLNKPFSFQSFVEALQRVEEAAPIPSEFAPATRQKVPKSTSPDKPRKGKAKTHRKREIVWENLSELVSIWVSKRSGTLVLAGDRPGSADVVDGGVVGAEGFDLLKASLLGGVVAFREGAIVSQGDWSRTGRILFKGARSGVDGRTLRRYMNAVPLLSEHGHLARSLPLNDGGRKFMGRVDGNVSVSDILERDDLPLGEVSRDIVALVRMGLVTFIRHESSDAQQSNVNEAVSAQRHEQKDASNPAHLSQSISPEQQLFARLEKEFATIHRAAPPVVLGIPADSHRSIVDKAATRMRQRYVEIVARRDISEDVRHLALEIAKRVDQAHRNFNFDQQISTGNRKANTPYVDEVETMIIQGREFISKKMWREADEVLAKAHQKRIDNVPVLANLGWARLHNPSMDLETRTEEGTDFLLLAEQFDPSDADGQYYLAQVLFASGRLEAAEQRAERAVKAAPEDKIRQALRRKIRLMVKQQNES